MHILLRWIAISADVVKVRIASTAAFVFSEAGLVAWQSIWALRVFLQSVEDDLVKHLTAVSGRQIGPYDGGSLGGFPGFGS